MSKIELYGGVFDKTTLAERVGSLGQICDARRMTYTEGRMAGVQAIEVTNGAGLAFSVLPSRGLDIAHASYKGVPLSWISSAGVGSPHFYEPEGNEWLRNFFGGLLTTCGLTQAGAPSEDGGEQLGLHGRAANTPASEVNVVKKWENDDYSIEISGNIHESKVFGDNLVLRRTIRTTLGSKRIFIHDIVENSGFIKAPLMMLYHINFGWPLLSENAEIVSSSEKVTPIDENAAVEINEWDFFPPPQDNYTERLYFHDLSIDDKGYLRIALVNKELGIGVYLKFLKKDFPYFVEWKMTGKGEYVVGLEPGNVHSTRAQMRKDGTLEYIEPGAERSFSMELGILDGVEEIESFSKEIERKIMEGDDVY